LDSLPPYQLYNLREDPGETKNLLYDEEEKVNELKSLLSSQIKAGRTTPGPNQPNDDHDGEWKQIAFIDN